MLKDAEIWYQEMIKIQPESDTFKAASNLADFIGSLTDELQIENGGSPGVFSFNRKLFASYLAPKSSPIDTDSWIDNIVDAWVIGISMGIIKSGTAKDPTWSVSGGIDTLTLPSGSVTIVNITEAKEILRTNLKNAVKLFEKSRSQRELQDKQRKKAEAYLKAAKRLKFSLIGLAPGTPPIPTPIIKGVE